MGEAPHDLRGDRAAEVRVQLGQALREFHPLSLVVLLAELLSTGARVPSVRLLAEGVQRAGQRCPSIGVTRSEGHATAIRLLRLASRSRR